MTRFETIQRGMNADIGAASLTRFGAVVLGSDESIEADMSSMLSDHCRLHVSRMANYETTETRKTDHATDLTNAVRLLAECEDISAVIYGCTSGELVYGPDLIGRVIRKVLPGAHVVTPIVAAAEAIRAHGVNSISILSPYKSDLNSRLVDVFGTYGIAVDVVYMPQDWDQRRLSTITRLELERAAASVKFADSDGLFIPCNALAVVDMITTIELLTAVPVFTSTQVSVWQALQNKEQLQAASLSRFGSLFSRSQMALQ